jgi:peroxiredoxin
MKNSILAIALLLVNFLFSQEETSKLKVGDLAPTFSFTDANGESQSLSDALTKGSLLLVFYRGEWCPYCTKYLLQLSESEDQFSEKGILIMAVSAENGKSLENMKSKSNSSFHFISDQGYEIITAFNVDYIVPSKMVEKLASKGIDLAESHGADEPMLPVPATFLIDQNGIIQYVHYDTNYKERPDVEDILAAVK